MFYLQIREIIRIAENYGIFYKRMALYYFLLVKRYNSIQFYASEPNRRKISSPIV
jgi:hypothetical protein